MAAIKSQIDHTVQNEVLGHFYSSLHALIEK